MAKKKYEEQDGVWRTIGGRRVFIRKGQSLSDAMKESGKFKKKDEKKKNIKTITQEEYDKLPNDYKGTLKELVDTAEFRGESKEELRKFYEKQGFNIEEDKTILENENGGTILRPVKVSKSDDKFYIRKDETKIRESISDMYKVYEEENGYSGKGKELLKFIKEEENDSGIKISKNLKNTLTNNPDKEFLFDNNNEKLTEISKQNSKEDKFYTRKDGTKEYDPYKGTRFEKKYDSVEEALNDPNHPTRKYIDEKLKVPRASGAKDFSEYGIRIEDNDTKTRFSDYLRDKYGTDDFRIISYDDSKKAQNIYSEFNKQELKAYQEKMLNNDEYLQANRPNVYFTKMVEESNLRQYQEKMLNNDEYLAKNNPGMYLNKIERESGVKTFGDEIRKNESINRVKNNRVVENIKTGDKYYEIGNGQWRSEKDGYDYYIDFNSSNIDNPKYRDVASGRIINTNPRADDYWDYEGNGLKSKYKGTIDYLQKTTNMNGSEILELLKRIDEDKK